MDKNLLFLFPDKRITDSLVSKARKIAELFPDEYGMMVPTTKYDLSGINTTLEAYRKDGYVIYHGIFVRQIGKMKKQAIRRGSTVVKLSEMDVEPEWDMMTDIISPDPERDKFVPTNMTYEEFYLNKCRDFDVNTAVIRPRIIGGLSPECVCLAYEKAKKLPLEKAEDEPHEFAGRVTVDDSLTLSSLKITGILEKLAACK